MEKVKVYFLALFFIGLIGCSEDEGSDDDSEGDSISNQTIQGTVFETNFIAAGGKAFDTSFGGVDQVSINITNTDANCDDYISDFDVYISTSVPFEVGTYEEVNVAFWKDGETPLNVLQSTVIIEEITDSRITVKIKSQASFSEDEVEGVFTVDYCE